MSAEPRIDELDRKFAAFYFAVVRRILENLLPTKSARETAEGRLAERLVDRLIQTIDDFAKESNV